MANTIISPKELASRINIPIPVSIGDGRFKLSPKTPTKAELNTFITKVMEKVVNDGRVTLKAEPPRQPRNVFQHTDMYGNLNINGFTCALEISSQKLLIGLKYDDYKKPGMTENQSYMALRVDVEKIIQLFEDIELS